MLMATSSVFVIVLPFVGVLTYLVVNGSWMANGVPYRPASCDLCDELSR